MPPPSLAQHEHTEYEDEVDQIKILGLLANIAASESDSRNDIRWEQAAKAGLMDFMTYSLSHYASLKPPFTQQAVRAPFA